MSDGYTQAQLDAIRAAIAKGEKSVTFADRTAVYRSMDELLQAEARIAAALAAGPKQTIVVAPRD
jgi:hypothetical protein